MLRDSKDSSVKYQLAEEVPFLVISEDLLIQVRRWVDFCAHQEGISQAWIGQVEDKNFVHWLTDSPEQALPAAFSEQAFQRTVLANKIFTFRNHEELISGGLFPLTR